MQPCNCCDPICPQCGAEYEKAMAEAYVRQAELSAQLDAAEWDAAQGKCNTCGGVSHYGLCDHNPCRATAIFERYHPDEEDWICRDHETGCEECVHEWIYDVMDRCDTHIIRECAVCNRVERQTVVEDDEY